MSSGHYCLIRDLGLVKGGKGLRHHEIVLDLSWRGLVQFTKAKLRTQAAWSEVTAQDDASAPVFVAQGSRASRR